MVEHGSTVADSVAEDVPEHVAAAAAAAAASSVPPPKVVVKHHDMPEEMQRVAVELAVVALGRFELERDMARFLKTEFDARYQPTWHCIVGQKFGSFLTGEAGGFLYFNVGKLAILLFRAGHADVQ
jgi:dynein light chain LC8-type